MQEWEGIGVRKEGCRRPGEGKGTLVTTKKKEICMSLFVVCQSPDEK